MNIKIGKIIKKLRTDNNITQDTLANAIGVTPQAISRWESENGYPDIELLPALADFFAVSMDELLGYKLSEREQELVNIKKEMSRLAEDGTIDERISLARTALSKYPSDYEIKNNLAVCLYHQWNDTLSEALIPEIESLCMAVVDGCDDEDERYNAVFTLISLYGRTGQQEKAKVLSNKLTPMKYCREGVLSEGIGDDNTEFYLQDYISRLTDALGSAISGYVTNDYLSNDTSTWDNKMEMLNISNQLYKLIYGENLMFYHTRLSWNYWLLSTYQIAVRKSEEALVSLEKMCYHAVEYDKSYIGDHGKSYTSVLTNKLTYGESYEGFDELSEHNNCYYMLDRLEHRRYNSIRDNERFVAVVKSLEEYAR